MPSALAGIELQLPPSPPAPFGAGAVARLPATVRSTGSDAAVVVTDAALAATPVVATVLAVLEGAGIPVTVFSGMHPTRPPGTWPPARTPSWRLAAAGRGGPRVALVAVGGGSPIDAAKGIALAAVDDEVLASTPRPPAADDFRSILLAC